MGRAQKHIDVCAEAADPTEGMSERQKKLFELQQRLKSSRKANQTAVMQERRRKQAPEGADEASEKRKWFEEKKKRKQADLEKLGLEEKDVRPTWPVAFRPLCTCIQVGTCIFPFWTLSK